MFKMISETHEILLILLKRKYQLHKRQQPIFKQKLRSFQYSNSLTLPKQIKLLIHTSLNSQNNKILNLLILAY